VACAAVFAAFTRPLLPPPPAPAQDASAGAPARAARIGAVALGAMFVLGLGGHLVESGAIDWANLHAARVLDADDVLAPLSYTVFACAMTVFRFLGDPIRARLGPGRALLCAGTLATAGYALVLVSGATGGLPLAWTGWILAGSGIALIVPVLFSAVSEAGGTSSNIALISISGSTGLLLGPAAIGYIGEAAGLTAGLLVPAVLAVFVAVAGPLTLRGLLKGRASEPAASVTEAG
jgi:MFS family permease